MAIAIAGILAVGPAIAEKPAWAGGGKGEKGERMEKPEKNKSRQRDGDERSSRDGAGSVVRMSEHFGDRHWTVVNDHYSEQFRRGSCPPGLAKKNNGCMPPGQAKKWQVGRPLPRDVIFYDLPPAVIVRLGRPPAGYRYVRVAADILLIAVGTAMVVDAIQDLSRM
ncbi:MAG: hypothetical protein AABZ67_04975 [Pseudomonadota bacterium]